MPLSIWTCWKTGVCYNFFHAYYLTDRFEEHFRGRNWDVFYIPRSIGDFKTVALPVNWWIDLTQFAPNDGSCAKFHKIKSGQPYRVRGQINFKNGMVRSTSKQHSNISSSRHRESKRHMLTHALLQLVVLVNRVCFKINLSGTS